MSARETLAEMRAIEQAAPPLPYRYREGGSPEEGPTFTALDGSHSQHGWLEIASGEYDAWPGLGLAFAADACNFVPKALAALDAVLALVRARTRTPAEDGSVDEYDSVGELADDILAAIEQALS